MDRQDPISHLRDYIHKVNIHFIGDTYLSFKIKCELYYDLRMTPPDKIHKHRDTSHLAKIKEFSYKTLHSQFRDFIYNNASQSNSTVGNIGNYLQDIKSQLYSNSYRYENYVLFFRKFSDNFVYINGSTVAFIEIEERTE